jgi:sugar (pentulose or hexulose) kinase
MKDAIAVLDIGKTNKKVLIYDKRLKILDKNVKAFGEVTDQAGLKLEVFWVCCCIFVQSGIDSANFV